MSDRASLKVEVISKGIFFYFKLNNVLKDDGIAVKYWVYIPPEKTIMFFDADSDSELIYKALVKLSKDWPSNTFNLEYSYSEGGYYHTQSKSVQDGAILKDIDSYYYADTGLYEEHVLEPDGRIRTTVNYHEVENGKYVKRSKSYYEDDYPDRSKIPSIPDNCVNEVFISDERAMTDLKKELEGKLYKNCTVSYDEKRKCVVATGFWIEDFDAYFNTVKETYPNASIIWNGYCVWD